MASSAIILLLVLAVAASVSSAGAFLVDDSFAQLENNGPEAWEEQLRSMDDQSAPLLRNLVGRSDPTWTPTKGSKNRYPTVQPYLSNRVRLQKFPEEDNSTYTDDYINASELRLPRANRRYIITQAPLDATISDFWRMVYQQNVKNIVMLCHKEGNSCAVEYWPTPKNPVIDNGATQATLVNRLQLPDLIITRVQLRHRNEPAQNITHYHYYGWQDMQIPNMQSFLTFLGRVQPALTDTSSPSVVHCTAGVGRSGTFVLVDSVLGMMQNGYDADVLQQLKDLRELRYGMVETPEQLRFAYEAVMAAERTLNKQ